MTSSVYMFLLISLILTSLTNGDAGLIQTTCKTTKYADLCVSILHSDPTSLNSDTKGLALILIRVATANATATSTFLSSQLLTTTNDTTLKTVLKECSHMYAFSGDALRASVQDFASESYDYAYMHVMAAADYPNACRNAFRRYPKLIYPQAIASREDELKHICDVVLGFSLDCSLLQQNRLSIVVIVHDLYWLPFTFNINHNLLLPTALITPSRCCHNASYINFEGL